MAKKRSSAQPQVQYWLFKSEPEVYSIEDLAREKGRTTCWDGVRNYQARNFLRDSIRVGDRVFFYHSNADPPAIVGTAEVVRAGYPDPTAFDPRGNHYDPKSRLDDPTWYMVDIRLQQIFPKPLGRAELQKIPELADMVLLQRGSRLSIQPVTAEQWKAIHRRAGVCDTV